ncbi:MAG: hypothetical protein U0103_01580 [Candidatus Obscuribacterales bacterium]
MDKKMWLPIFVAGTVLLPVTVESRPAARPPARPARAGASSGASNTAAYTAYLARLRGKLLNNWDVPNGKNKVTLTTTVAADGSVGDVALSSSPKSADAEIAGSEAFAKSQPLETIPGGAQVKLILTFESSADPHGDSSSNVYTQIVPIPAAKAASAASNTASDPSSAGAAQTK